MKNEIILYQADQLPERLEVIVKLDTVWLNRKQISFLFDRDIKTIGKHINNIFSEKELDKNAVVANFATTAKDGKIYQVDHYNLDVIISVGYRVKSFRGTQFRIWANKVIKDHLLNGYSINRRLNTVENNIDILNEKVSSIDLRIKTKDLPTQGIFFDGQIFDAYNFISDLIKKAERSIILIDNYIDDSVLTHFTKRKDNVELIIYTKNIGKQLQLDIEKYNGQYSKLKIKEFNKSHDRFMIIDDKDLYQIGASLKDLGKKWFAFTKLSLDPKIILERLK